MFQVAVLPVATSPLNMSRNAAIVQASVFEAVNGIERRYSSIHDTGLSAPRGASQRAAAIQAAYASLVHLYGSTPGALTILDAARASSLAGIASEAAVENSESIARGIAWGQQAADAIWAWRSTDGFNTNPPTFVGMHVNGVWRPTPPAFGKGVGYPQFAAMTPWVMQTPSDFRPGPPPSLTSPEYLADFAETKAKGTFTRANPTSDETALSLFWNAGTATAYWDHAATSFSDNSHFNLSENARLFALVNLAMADAAIACWDAKYTYVFWRPITAIAVANGEDPDNPIASSWQTLFPTPAHPDYPSGHSCVSGAAARVLTAVFGDNTPFTLAANAPVVGARSYENFSDALAEVRDARVFSGIHFRTATEVGNALGETVADLVLEKSLVPLHGQKKGLLK